MNNYCEGLTEKDKEESRRNTVVFQDFLTQYFAVRTSNKIQELVGGAIRKDLAVVSIDSMRYCLNQLKTTDSIEEYIRTELIRSEGKNSIPTVFYCTPN